MRHPTLLAVLMNRHHWTSADAVAVFEETARNLGRPCSVSERQWDRWCAGDIKGAPRPLCCRVLESMFDCPVEELFASPPQAVSAGRRISTPESRAYWTGTQTAFRSAPDSVLTDEEIAVVADESARFTRRVRRVDEHALEQLDADVRRLAVEYLRRPPYFTFRQVAELRADVFAMLDERHPLRQERHLYLIAGMLCALLAHASADLGHPYAAETHARTALVCAELTEDNPLRAYTRWVQSNVAYWQGDYRRAAAIAHDARSYATSGTALLRLTSQEARALAAAGDAWEFRRTIGAALDARHRGQPSDEPGVLRFSPGKAAYYASEAYRALGEDDDLQRAESEAREAVQLLTADPADHSTELIAAARLDLSAAYLASNDLDGGEEALLHVLRMQPEHRTVPVVQRVQGIGAQLVEYGPEPRARELLEQVALFTAHPATTPQLPSGSE